MSDQHLVSREAVLPGAPFMIQMLFKSAVSMPDKAWMRSVLERHLNGRVASFGDDSAVACFAALEHLAKFKDVTVPVQLMVMECMPFDGTTMDEFIVRQMWDCPADRDRILRECRHQVLAVDMLGAGLPTIERANLDMDFLDALAEIYPTCEAFYFPNCRKLFLADDVRHHGLNGVNRFIQFGINVRFFTILGTDDMVVDTVGMSTLFLPDLQYYFHDLDQNAVVTHACHLASYILKNDNPIKDGDMFVGMENGHMTHTVKWECHYENAIVLPPRAVLDVHTGPFASGGRS